MSGIDIIILILIAFGLLNGLKSGFVSELIALISLILAIFLSLNLYGVLMPYLKNEVFSIVGMFIIVYFSSQFILNLVAKPFKIAMGGTVVNKILGSILGAIEMALFVSVLAYFIRWSNFYAQFSQNSKVLKLIEERTFPIYEKIFKKDERNNT
ncbi:MAG: CvpA family protein [candidate division WOR-3 bacterium]|nr:CvpA family protein [candidate division WOR-3 bacterium]MCX7948249.1 CvpA family protein [candidate division WOR-3 bacterium]MDW8151226.1 CvpA family protein [candidate division WOR-3 bacterium]